MATPQESTSSRLFITAMGLFFVVIGLAFTWLLWSSYQRAEETRHWQPTLATITQSLLLSERATPNSPVKHKPSVHYRYDFAGQSHTGERITRADGWLSDRANAEAKSEKYPLGQSVTCYVNPSEPKTAVLEHTNRGGLYSIWFPLLFVVGGFGMIWSHWRKTKSARGINLPSDPSASASS